MTRIIAGQARGRRLIVPRAGTRPTSDRVREAMFASIESRLVSDAHSWTDVSVCDLWAGSGAIALEAWSRGALRVVAIDKAKVAIDAIRANIESVGAATISVLRAPVSQVVQSAPPGGAFDVVIADPPYEVTEVSVRRDLAAAHESGWFAVDALVLVERGAHSESPFPGFVKEVEVRPYGDTALWYGRVRSESGDSEDRHEI